MVILNEAIAITAASIINDGKKDVQVAYMTANIPKEGNMSSSRNIQDKEMFEIHKDEVLLDFKAFDEYVYGLMEEKQKEQE
ncbi:hypothetical protein D7V86_24845 [bacterium D16-51]|nr:hypothetical protein D7V96_23475 [bacterium D16-59]RKI53608.1 hypothetical protein D7V86_24845 [bacterium D16-51]